MTVHFIHGIHATRKNATSQLAPFFRAAGFACEVHRYGYALALTSGLTNWLNARRAAKLAQRIKPGDSIVAHSNGCAIAWLIQREHVHLSALILMQPALDNDKEFTGTDCVLIVHNELDDVAEHARFGLFSAWGNMGRVGYYGKGHNVEGWDSLAPPHDLPAYAGHTGFVTQGAALLRRWGEALATWLKQKGVKNA